MKETVRTDGNAMNYVEHEKTYERFLTLFKWGTIHVIAILVLMAIFLV